MLNKLKAAAAVLCFTLVAGTARAVTITATQGTYFNGTVQQPYASNPDDSREILANATDGNPATFYVLGINGDLTINVSPQVFASPATVIEVTFGSPNPNFPEAAKVYLDGVLKGELFNNGTATTNSGAAIVAASTPTGATFIIPIEGNVSMLRLLDTTFVNYAAVYTGNNRANDGFDVGEITYTAVPIPPAALLFGTALIGMGFLSRRRKQKLSAI